MHTIARSLVVAATLFAVAGCDSGEEALRDASAAVAAAAGADAQRPSNLVAVDLTPAAFAAITEALNAAKPEQRTVRLQQTGYTGNLWNGTVDCLPGGWWRQTRGASVFFTHQDASRLQATLGPLAFNFELGKITVRTTVTASGRSHLKANLDCRPFPARPSVEVTGAVPETPITLSLTMSVSDADEIRYAVKLVEAPGLAIRFTGGLGLAGTRSYDFPVNEAIDRGIEGSVGAAIAKEGLLQIPGAEVAKRYAIELQELKPTISPQGLTVTAKPVIRWLP